MATAATTTAAGKGGIRKLVWQKNAISSFLDAKGNKNTGATIRIGREIRCIPYAFFFLALRLLRSNNNSNYNYNYNYNILPMNI